MHEVLLTTKMTEFVNRAISRGQYASLDEMVNAGLRHLNELHGGEPYRLDVALGTREESRSPHNRFGIGSSDTAAAIYDPDLVRHVEQEVDAGIYLDVGEGVRAAVRALMEKDGLADFFRLQASVARSFEGPFIEVTVDELIESMRAGMLDRAEEPSAQSN